MITSDKEVKEINYLSISKPKVEINSSFNESNMAEKSLHEDQEHSEAQNNFKVHEIEENGNSLLQYMEVNKARYNSTIV